MNSALQCLAHAAHGQILDYFNALPGLAFKDMPVSAAFWQFLREMRGKRPYEDTNGDEGEDPIGGASGRPPHQGGSAFGWRNHHAISSAGGHGGAFSPWMIKRALAGVDRRFLSSEQQDSQEFIMVLLDAMYEEHQKKLKSTGIHQHNPTNSNNGIAKEGGSEPESPSKTDSREAPASQPDDPAKALNPIFDTFYGKCTSTVTCGECGHESITVEPFLTLGLPVPHAKKQQQQQQQQHAREREREMEQRNGHGYRNPNQGAHWEKRQSSSTGSRATVVRSSGELFAETGSLAVLTNGTNTSTDSHPSDYHILKYPNTVMAYERIFVPHPVDEFYNTRKDELGSDFYYCYARIDAGWVYDLNAKEYSAKKSVAYIAVAQEGGEQQQQQMIELPLIVLPARNVICKLLSEHPLLLPASRTLPGQDDGQGEQEEENEEDLMDPVKVLFAPPDDVLARPAKHLSVLVGRHQGVAIQVGERLDQGPVYQLGRGNNLG